MVTTSAGYYQENYLGITTIESILPYTSQAYWHNGRIKLGISIFSKMILL